MEELVYGGPLGGGQAKWVAELARRCERRSVRFSVEGGEVPEISEGDSDEQESDEE